MKKQILTILAMFAITVSIFYAQNILDPQPLNLDSTYILSADSAAAQFKLGWNWGSIGYKLDDAMQMGYLHQARIKDIENKPLIGNNSKMIIQPECSGGHMHVRKLNAMAIQFDPAISVDTTTSAKPASWDNKGAIFGFFNKNLSKGYIDSNVSSPTFFCCWRFDVAKFKTYPFFI